MVFFVSLTVVFLGRVYVLMNCASSWSFYTAVSRGSYCHSHHRLSPRLGILILNHCQQQLNILSYKSTKPIHNNAACTSQFSKFTVMMPPSPTNLSQELSRTVVTVASALDKDNSPMFTNLLHFLTLIIFRNLKLKM